MSHSLFFLNEASNDDLRTLCDILCKDKNGDNRFTEELTSTEAYKQNYPHNMKALVPDMICELRRFGGNTFMNILRGGEGPEYKEVLYDVAKHCKARCSKDDSEMKIEEALLHKLFEDRLEQASDEDLKAMMCEYGMPVTNFSRQMAVAALMTFWRSQGFASYKLLVTVANSLVRFLMGRGLTIVANATLTRTAAVLTGPIGWTFMGVWTAIDVASAAYRVTVPAVVQIAMMRLKYLHTLPQGK